MAKGRERKDSADANVQAYTPEPAQQDLTKE